MNSLEKLTPKQRLVALKISEGYEQAEAAEELRIKIGTFKRHLTDIYGKLGFSGNVKLGVLIYHESLQNDPEPPAKPFRALKDILTERELKIAKLVHCALGPSDIAPLIGSTEGAVKQKLWRIYEKLGFSNCLELALRVELECFHDPSAILEEAVLVASVRA